MAALPVYHTGFFRTRRLMSSSFPPTRLRFLVSPLLALLLGVGAAQADDAADIARLARSGQGEEALRRIDALLAKQPADAQMRFMKGVMLSETRPADAIAIFTKLTQDYPKLPEPYNNLAVLYAAAGQYDKARAALDKALRTHPAYATAFDNLGDVHARLASQAYDKALQIQPGKPAPAQLALMRNLTLPGAQSTSLAPVAAAATPAAAPQPPAPPAPVAVAPVKPAPPAVTIIATAPVEIKPAAPVVKAESRPAPAAAPREALPPRPEPARADAKRAEPPVRLVKADKTEKPDPKARAAQEAAAEREAVLSAVQSWARAWSARDVQAYLAHYAPDFDPAGGMTRKAWVEERQQRISGKGRIKVDIDKPQVTTEGNTAIVHFRQSYVSDRLSATSRKTLELERQRGKWLIKQERTG